MRLKWLVLPLLCLLLSGTQPGLSHGNTEPEDKPQTSCSPSKHAFELLHDKLKDNYNEHVNTVFSSFGFFLLAIGWFMTSKEGRSFLESQPYLATVATMAVVVIFLAHIFVLLHFQGKSDDLISLLQDNSYAQRLGEDYYSQYAIEPWVPWASLCLTAPMALVLAVFTISLRTKKAVVPRSRKFKARRPARPTSHRR